MISKDIYGQFAEHLGTGIYGGMWVGTDSKIPNTKGWRNDVVAALKNLHVPVVRWPGGCFANEYHWRDGIGPQKRRPVRSNGNWGGEETNAVGTHEFFALAELIGADAYINGNLGSGSVHEMAEWLEYMTSESKSTLAELRRKNGHEQPFNIAYFALGNEAWGCGGNMEPEAYVNLYRRYATFLRLPPKNRPILIASGGTGEDTKWTGVLSNSLKNQTDAISFHYYTIPTGQWDVKGPATGFTESQWIATLSNTLKMDSFIKANVAVLDKNDPEKKIGFDIDEWGTWYDQESEKEVLRQQNTLRDAIVAALNFHIFHAHADRVRMTNIAQMVNVLQSMILTDGKRMVLTPTYHVYSMYVPFQNASALHVSIANNPQYKLGDISIASLSASAARGRDGKLYLSLVNVNPASGLDVQLDVTNLAVSTVQGKLLTGEQMDAHNNFSNPEAVKPTQVTWQSIDGKLNIKLPAKAVLVLEIL